MTRAHAFFSEAVDAALRIEPADAAIDALRKLVEEAALDKADGYGPPLDELNYGRRKLCSLITETYRRAA